MTQLRGDGLPVKLRCAHSPLSGYFIRILYSLLTPSPLAMAAPTTSHIPTANAFFYRSLPCFPLATVSERSIRKRRLFPQPRLPLPRAAVAHGRRRGFDLIRAARAPSRVIGEFRACKRRRFRDGPKRLLLSHDVGAIGFGRRLKCLLLMRRRSSVHFGDLINTGGLLSRVSPLFLLPSHLLPPCPTWLHLTRHSFIGSPPRINMVPH